MIELTDKQLFEIAKICDNEYNGKWDVLKIIPTDYGDYITTTTCDNCSIIRVFYKTKEFDVHRTHADHDGSVHPNTMLKIKQYLGF